MNCSRKLFFVKQMFNVLYRCSLRRRFMSKLLRGAAILLVGRIDCINSIDLLSLRGKHYYRHIIVLIRRFGALTGVNNVPAALIFSNTVTWFLHYYPLLSRNHFDISVKRLYVLSLFNKLSVSRGVDQRTETKLFHSFRLFSLQNGKKIAYVINNQ